VESPDVNSAHSVAQLREIAPQIICVVDFGQFIGRRVRQVPQVSIFNLHGSLLPQLRGAAPVNWAIIRGYRRTGVTTFEVVREMDAGPIYLQKDTTIGDQETAEQLAARLAQIGAETVCRTVELLACGRADGVAQDHDQATFAPKLTKADGRIDWSADAVSICNRIRGTWPWPGGQAVFVRSDGRQMPVIIARARPGQGQGEAGVIDQDLLAGSGSGRVEIIEIKPAGKRLMTWRDFVNGYRVAAGDRFVEPK